MHTPLVYCFLAFFPLDPGNGPSSFGKRKKRGFLFIPFSFTLSVLFFSFSSSFLLPLQTIQLNKWMPPLFSSFPLSSRRKMAFLGGTLFFNKSGGFWMQVGNRSFLFFLLSIFHFLLFLKGKRRFFFRETVTFFRGNSTLWPKKCAPNSSLAVSWLHQFPPLSKGQKTHCVEEEGPKEEEEEEEERYLLAGFFSSPSSVREREGPGWSSCADFFFFSFLPSS